MVAGILCGFESGDTSEPQAVTGTVSVQSGITRGTWSAYALRCNPTTTAVGSALIRGYLATTGVPAAGSVSYSTAYARFGFLVATPPGSGSEPFMDVVDVANATKATLRLNANGTIALYDAVPSLIATGTAVLANSTWYRIEVKCGTGGGGAFEWKVDGAVDVSTTVASLSANNTGAVRLGKSVNTNSQTVDYYFDDLLVDDTAYPGDGRSVLFPPAGDGTYQTATVGAGSGQHYLLVNDVPSNDDTDYLVTDNTIGHAETEAFSLDFPFYGYAGGTINAVKAHVRIKRDGGTDGSIKLRWRGQGGTEVDTSTATGSASTYATRASVRPTDPDTSAAWAQPNTPEFGIIEQSAANKTRLTTVLLMVDYVPTQAAIPVFMNQYRQRWN